MPGMNGQQLASIVIERRPEIKVLYISGYADQGIVESGLLDKDSAFISKSFSPSALAGKVQALIAA